MNRRTEPTDERLLEDITRLQRDARMTRFVAFDDRALGLRVQRLKRGEVELQERIQTHVAQAQRAGHYVAADPAYQRLTAILRNVRQELDLTAQEQLRRETSAKRRPTPHGKRIVPRRAGRTSERRGPKVMAAQKP